MASFRSLMTVITLGSLVNFSTALYDPSSKANVAAYWGQAGGQATQQRLAHFCNDSSIDIIPLAFVDFFPAQGNGYPGDNFANMCSYGSFVYQGPGNDSSKNQLQSECPTINEDIPVCQSYGKKVILSLGGAGNTYQLNGTADGIYFANFLWGAFGPQTPEWLAKGLPRPFDGPNNEPVEVDGFDFDIEHPSTDNSAGYIAMLTRLRELYTTASKKYLITGAPQCQVPDHNMAQMIAAVKFDIIFIQFYNTAYCSARAWVDANPNYVPGMTENENLFGYNDWTNFINNTASEDAVLYIGLPGDVDPTNPPYNYFLDTSEVSKLIEAYICNKNFGGIMLWDANSADDNANGPYQVAIKKILTNYTSNLSPICNAPPYTSTTTVTSTGVVTPKPIQTGMVTNCNAFYLVKSGDICYSVISKFGLSLATFYLWNPAVGADCSNLDLGDYVCVGISASTTTVTTTTISSNKVSKTSSTLTSKSANKASSLFSSSSFSLSRINSSAKLLSSTTFNLVSSTSSSKYGVSSSLRPTSKTSSISSSSAILSSSTFKGSSSTSSRPSSSISISASKLSSLSSTSKTFTTVTMQLSSLPSSKACSSSSCCPPTRGVTKTITTSVTTKLTLSRSQTSTSSSTASSTSFVTSTSSILWSNSTTKSTTKTSSSTSSSVISTTSVAPPWGACGSKWGISCTGSDCCSQYGYCGLGTGYCGTGCQVGYGVCS